MKKQGHVNPFMTESVRRWMEETRGEEKLRPWYVQDESYDCRASVAAYGHLRRAGSMLRVAYIVIREWCKSPYEADVPTNGAMLLSKAVSTVVSPLTWMATLVGAGLIGAQLSSVRSGVVLTADVASWIAVAIALAAVMLIWQWWRTLEQLKRVLGGWVSRCNDMSTSELDEQDIALFGYTVGKGFRSALKVRDVRWLAALTVSFAMVVGYGSTH